MGYGELMKTTLGIPDPLFREAKEMAARQGMTLKQFVTEALEAKLNALRLRNASTPAWERFFGTFKSKTARADSRKINAVVEKEFSTVDSDGWK